MYKMPLKVHQIENKTIVTFNNESNNNLVKNIINNNILSNNQNIELYLHKNNTVISYNNDNDQEYNRATNPFILKFVITRADINNKKNIINLPFDSQANVTVNWDYLKNTISNTTTSNTYVTQGTYQVAITGSATSFGPDLNSDVAWEGVDKITQVISFGNIGITNFFGAFLGATKLKSVPNGPRFSANVTNMKAMFSNAILLNSDLSNWDVSKVTDMSYMFSDTMSFNYDLSKWDVSKVTDMNNMFNRASSFNYNLSKWNVSKVTNMTNMFGRVRPTEPLKFSQANWDSTLIGWSKRVNLIQNVILDAPIKHSSVADAAYKKLTNTYKWKINEP